MLTALFWIAFGAAVVAAIVGWVVAGDHRAERDAQARRFAEERRELQTRIESLTDQLAAADRAAIASAAADGLFADLLAAGVPRGTKTDGEAVDIAVEDGPPGAG